MTHNDWLASLNLPLGCGVTTSEAFDAGRESYEADIRKLWLDAEDLIEWAEEIEILIRV